MLVNVSDAPWSVLLAPDMQLPAKFGWLPCHMIVLRGVCKGLRAGSSSDFFANILQSAGLHGQFELLSAQHSFRLCQRVCEELLFVHQAQDAAVLAARLSARDTPPCVVAGSWALHRMLMMKDGEAPEWKPGDIDLFVSGCREPWTENDIREHRRAHEEPGGAGALADLVGFGGPPPFKELDPLGKMCNSVVHDVVELARALMHRLHPGLAIRVEEHDAYTMTDEGEHVQWSEPMEGDLRAYSRGELLGALPEEERERLGPAIVSQLPEHGGFLRPHQLGKIVKVTLVPDKTDSRGGQIQTFSDVDFLVALAEHGDVSNCRWGVLRSINIVELASEVPLTARDITGGFDMLQCGVAAVPTAGLGLRFECSEETRECIAKRELRFSRFIMGPLRQKERVETRTGLIATRESRLRDVARGLSYRCHKYEMRGFAAIDLRNGSRLPPPLAQLPPLAPDPATSLLEAHAQVLERLLLTLMAHRMRPLAEIVQYMLPVLLEEDLATGVPALLQPGAACFASSELATALERLLRRGDLFAVVPSYADRPSWLEPARRLSVDDGFPLLCSLRRLHNFNQDMDACFGNGEQVTAEVLAALDEGDLAGTEPPERLLPPQLPMLATIVPALVQATIHYSGQSMAELREALCTDSRFTDAKELLEQRYPVTYLPPAPFGQSIANYTCSCSKKTMVRALAATFARLEVSYVPGGEGFLEAQDEYYSTHL